MPVLPEPLRLTATLDGGRPGRVVLEATDVAISGRLPVTSLHVAALGRLLITGPNGCGKSTLLRILAGQLAPERG